MSKNNSIDDLFKRHKAQAERPPSEEIWMRLEKKLDDNRPRRRLLLFNSQWTAIAAVLLLLLLPTTYLLITTNRQTTKSVAHNQLNNSQTAPPTTESNHIAPDNEEIADAGISQPQKTTESTNTPAAAPTAAKQVAPAPTPEAKKTTANHQNKPATAPTDRFVQPDMGLQNNPQAPRDQFKRDGSGQKDHAVPTDRFGRAIDEQANQPVPAKPTPPKPSSKPTTPSPVPTTPSPVPAATLPESENPKGFNPSASNPLPAKKETNDSDWSALPTESEIDIKNWNTPDKFVAFLQTHVDKQKVSVKPVTADFVKTAHKKAFAALLQQQQKAPFVVRKRNNDHFSASSTVGNEVLVLLYCMKQKTSYPPQQRTAEMMPTPENIEQMRKWAEN